MFSIITVTLNSAAYVRRAIQSVVEQDDGILQYIVIDGKSRDETVAIAESFRPVLGGRLVVISEPDRGLYDAMNKGIALATGEVIGILNSDDQYRPGALEAVRRAFASGDADVVYGDTEMKHDGETRIHHADVSGLDAEMSLGHPACFVRRSTYQRWGTFDINYRIAADYDLLLRFRQEGARFVHLPLVLATFHLGGVSSTDVPRSRREVSEIQARHLGVWRARRNSLRVSLATSEAKIRRSIGTTLLGEARYEGLRKWLARRFR